MNRPSVLSLARAARLHPSRLLVAPRLGEPELRGDDMLIEVHGLVCGVCAARTRAAFARLPDVGRVDVDLDAGSARLTPRPGATLRVSQLERAMDGVVWFRGARAWIERIARGVRAGRGRR